MKRPLEIIYLSTFPPRECGIATFTADLTNAMDDLLGSVIVPKIAALNTDDVTHFHYPKKVAFQIDQNSLEEFVKTAEKINGMDRVKLVNIQHEFGIFGGKRGSHVISFLQALKKPSVVTFHSVLPQPEDELCRCVRAIAENAGNLVVMTSFSRHILVHDYRIPEEKILVIPHGIHSIPYSSSVRQKAALGFAKKTTFVTFGLLSRGKGIEYAIEAMPRVVRHHPEALYLVLGVTHPNVIREEGESYRHFLVQKVRELGLSSHVKFYNEYASLGKLLQFLKATDVYLSTSLNPNQAVSGTLSYALGSGRPVISTPFAQAKEFVTEETGLLVNFRDPDSYAEAMIRLLSDPQKREQMGKNAYFRTRNMIWENVAVEYSKLFSKHSADVAEAGEQKKIPRLNLNHMGRLTDGFGMMQFSHLSRPDPASGYTADDNARALIVSSLCLEKIKAGKERPADTKRGDLLGLARTYLGFLESARGAGDRFINYVRPDRKGDGKPDKNENLDDANGRALWALAVAAQTRGLPKSARNGALALFGKSIRADTMFTSPRAMAFFIKGLCLLLKNKRKLSGIDLTILLKNHCDRLALLYRKTSSAKWQWFEKYLTYSNAVLPEALLLGYQRIKKAAYRAIGIKTLAFLMEQTFIDKMYVPIGQNGWHHKTGERRYFDQQPEDASAMVLALATAHAVTGDDIYKKRMLSAFNWFLGDNCLKQVLYDRTTGGCYDGLGERYINLNQGAESTLSYLLARLAITGV